MDGETDMPCYADTMRVVVEQRVVYITTKMKQ